MSLNLHFTTVTEVACETAAHLAETAVNLLRDTDATEEHRAATAAQVLRSAADLLAPPVRPGTTCRCSGLARASVGTGRAAGGLTL